VRAISRISGSIAPRMKRVPGSIFCMTHDGVIQAEKASGGCSAVDAGKTVRMLEGRP
jgi:hypothetical protein